MAFTLPLGSPAPEFSLAGADGRVYNLRDFKRPILVIFFNCNHCPNVRGSEEYTRVLAEDWHMRGVQFVAINSNSPETYAEDSFANMAARFEENPFPWPYLYDPDQAIARAYGALRTPHFFIFDAERKLHYCGCQFNKPRNVQEGDQDYVQMALEDLTDKKPLRIPLTNPVGCNVKWHGKEAHWMPPEACDLV